VSKKTPLNSINLKIKPNKAAALCTEQFGGMGGIPPFFFSPSSTGALDGAFFKVLDEFSDGIENTLKDVHNSLDNWNNMRQGNYPDLFYNHLKLMKNDKIVKNSFMDLSWFFSIFKDFRIFDSNAADPGMRMGDDQAETDELKTTGIFNPHKLHVDKRLINIFKKHQFGPGSKLNEIGMSDYALYGKPSAHVTKENNSVFNRLRRLYLELKREKYIVVSDDNFKKIAKRVAANNKLEYQRFCYLLLEPFIYIPGLDDQLTEGDPDEQPDVMNEAFKKYKNKKLKNDAFSKAAVKLMASSFLNSKGEMKLEDINPRQAVASAGSPSFGVALALGIGGFHAVQKSLEAVAKKMAGRPFAGPITMALLAMALLDGEVDYQLLKAQVNKIKGALQKTLKKHEKEENWSDDELAGVLYDIIDELQRTVLSKFRNFLGSSAFRSLGDKDGDKSSSVNGAYRAFAAEYQKIADIATGVRNLGFSRGQAINKRKAEHMLNEAESLEDYISESYKPAGGWRAVGDWSWRMAKKVAGSIRDEARADLREAEGLKTYCRKDLEMLVLSEIRAGGSTVAVNEAKLEKKKIEMNKSTWKKCKDKDIKALAAAWTECLGVGEAMERFPSRRESRKLAAEIRSLSIEKDTMNVKLADPEIAYYRLYKESSIPRRKLSEGLVPKDNPECKEAYLNTLYTSDIRTGFYNRFLFGLEKENIGSYEVTIAPNYTGQEHSTTVEISVPFAYYHEQESQNHKDLLKAGDIKGILSHKALMAQTAMKDLLVATKAVVAAGQGIPGADGKFVEVFKDCLLILEPLFDKIQDLLVRDETINKKLNKIKINVQDLTENKWDPDVEAQVAKSNPDKAKDYKANMIKVENYHRLAKQKIEVLMHLQMLSSILDNSSIPYVYHNFNGVKTKAIADTWREKQMKTKEKQQAPAVPAIPADAKKPADVQVPPQDPVPQSVPTAVKKTGGQPSSEYQRKQSSLLKSLNIKPADLVKRLQDAGYFGNDKRPTIKEEETKEEALVYTSEFKEAIIKLQKSLGLPDCAGDGKPCADGLYGSGTHKRWEAEKARAAAAQAKPAEDPFNGFTGRGLSQKLKIGKYLIWYSPGSIPKPTIELIDVESSNVYSTKGKGIGFVSNGIPHYHPRKNGKLPANVKIPYDLNNTMHRAVSGMPSTIPAKDHDAWDAAYVKRRDGKEDGPTQDRTNSKADQKKKNKPTLQQRLKSVGIDADFWLSAEKLKYSDNKNEGESMNSYLKTIVDTYVNSITRLNQIGMPSDEARELVEIATIRGIRASSAALEKKIKGHEVFMKTQITELPAKVWKDARPGRGQLTYNIKASSSGKGSWSGEVGDPKAPEWVKMDFIGWDSNYVRKPHSVLLKLSLWAQNVLDKKLRSLYLEAKAAGEKSAPAAPAPESAPAAHSRPKKHRVKKDDKSAQFNMDDLLKQAIAEVKRGRNNNE
jgi:hypothetical protein